MLTFKQKLRINHLSVHVDEDPRRNQTTNVLAPFQCNTQMGDMSAPKQNKNSELKGNYKTTH